MTSFGQRGTTIALLIALAYVVQIQSAAWYVQIADRIFGSRMKHFKSERKEPVGYVSETDTAVLKPVATISQGLVPDIRKILYATDLSQTARHAARYACSLGHRFGAEVHIIHVIQDVLDALSNEAGVSFADIIEHDDWKAFQKESLEKAKLVINQRIHEASLDVKEEIPLCPLSEDRVSVEVGDPVQTILSVADKGRFDLIVMGTHGHGKLERAVLGSVARDVVKKSLIPVMVVRLPEARPTRQQTEVKNEITPLQVLTG
jgi:nucleotide-binding universal stress UspA family protein